MATVVGVLWKPELRAEADFGADLGVESRLHSASPNQRGYNGSMFLPLGDSPNFRFTPWVTWSLIALNILVFLSCLPMSLRPADPADPAVRAYAQVLYEELGTRPQGMSAYDGFVFLHGFKPAHARVTNILSAMFLHGGWMHLIGNMLFLWIYGDNVEYRLGRIGYLLAYLGTGAAAALADGLLRHGSLIPSIGASGAISGVLGLYFIWFPKNRVRVWIFLFPIFMDIVELPARFVLGVFLIIDNILPMLFSSGHGGVAHGAHLGGFAAGVGLALLLDRYVLRKPEAPMRRSVNVPVPGGLGTHLEQGDLSGALDAFARLPKGIIARGAEAESGLELAGKLQNEGHFRSALSVYQRLSQHHPDSRTRAAARLGQARILLERLRLPAEAYQQLAAAIREGLPRELEPEARSLLRKLQAMGSIPRGIRLA